MPWIIETNNFYSQAFCQAESTSSMASYGSDYVIWPTGNQDRSYLISFQQNFPEKINLKEYRIVMSFCSILEPEMLFQNICLLETDSKRGEWPKTWLWIRNL